MGFYSVFSIDTFTKWCQNYRLLLVASLNLVTPANVMPFSFQATLRYLVSFTFTLVGIRNSQMKYYNLFKFITVLQPARLL